MAKMIIPTETKSDPLIHRRINRMPVNKDSIEAMTPETEKKATGTFINVECPGQPAKVCGKFYRGQEFFCKTFEDNEHCTIPLSVARFINERCQLEEHSYLLDEKGNPIKTGKKKARYKFMIDMVA
jgi:hypothetical protein